MNTTRIRKPRRIHVIKEKGLRGQVPSRLHGPKDKIFATYLDTLNPRGNDELQQALAACPDVRFQLFLEKVMTPRYLKVSLSTMAKGCGISLPEFQKWYSNEQAQRSIAEAQAASPRIVRGLIDDSIPRLDICDRCDGLGWVDAPSEVDPEKIPPGYRQLTAATKRTEAAYIRTCPRCDGNGKIRQPGDAHAQDRVLGMAGVTESAKGPAVVVNFGGASHSSAVTLLNDAMSIEGPKVVDSNAEDLE